MRIAIASDHGGFEYKCALIEHIQALDHTVTDLGCADTSSVDYPDYAIRAAEAVASGECERGIVVCGTGIGVSIAANKVRKIRCALCTDELMARLTREHNDANMLALGGRIIGIELAKAIVTAFLTTPFSNGDRHIKRIAKITEYENNNTK